MRGIVTVDSDESARHFCWAWTFVTNGHSLRCYMWRSYIGVDVIIIKTPAVFWPTLSQETSCGGTSLAESIRLHIHKNRRTTSPEAGQQLVPRPGDVAR